MAQSPEIELIDQLSGADMPLSVALGLFATENDARRVIASYVKKGTLALLGQDAPLPKWRAGEALRDMDNRELRAQNWTLSLTDEGVKAFETGNWTQI